jgi:predicted nucleic acid-binding protein
LRTLRVDDELLDAAARVGPLGLRSLDAIHVASALLVADALGVVVYDERLSAAMAAAGLPVAAPR